MAAIDELIQSDRDYQKYLLWPKLNPIEPLIAKTKSRLSFMMLRCVVIRKLFFFLSFLPSQEISIYLFIIFFSLSIVFYLNNFFKSTSLYFYLFLWEKKKLIKIYLLFSKIIDNEFLIGMRRYFLLLFCLILI